MEPAGGSAVCPECGGVGDAVALMPLFVVTGASGSGKTAVLAPLARRLQGRCVTFDADLLMDAAGGLSGGQPINWTAFREAWLAAVHGVALSGVPTVLLGPFIPEHFRELPGRHWITDIHFIVLDCPDDLRRARISARPPWLRRNIADCVAASSSTQEDTAAVIAAWIERCLAG